jgi:transposase
MEDRRKVYRAWDAQLGSQKSVSPQEVLPEDDLVFFLLDIIPQLDLSTFHQHYAVDMRGQPPFDVTMMVTLLVYAYAVGVCSSRKVAAACERNLAFRAIVGVAPPDFRTISDFRKIHLAAFRPFFLEVLRLAGEMGMVKLGNLSTDGTKLGANASRHKAMSYAYMDKNIKRLEAEIEQLLKQAEQTDAEQDAALGSRRGDELKRREDRLAKIRPAKARLEAEARAKAEEEQRRRDEEQALREAEGRKRRGKEPAPIDPTPEDKAQTNFTDPEAKIMKQSNKGFDYSYNAQAVVAVPAVTGAPAAAASAKEKMQHKLRSATGKLLYAARKKIIEPVFGQIKSARGIRKFLLRGLEKVSAEWQLICLTHNLLKIWRRATGVAVS